MKIALVQDGLMCRAGGEQVALCFHKAFPNAPIYTQCYQPDLTFPEFRNCDVRTTWLQRIARTDDMMKNLFFPLGIWAMQSHDLTEFDVVLMSSTHCAKYVKVNKNALVINYCHTPFRLVWNPESYAQYNKLSGIKKKIFDVVLRIMRDIDFRYAQRPNLFLANTNETAERARASYQIDKPTVIEPPVNSKSFFVSNVCKEYFLIVSRLEYYKKVDMVIDAFNRLGYPLIVVGKGTLETKIKASAKQNITFMSGLSSNELANVYAGCRAFIFPQHEDYGITPLEANAAGRPVIAYAAGGVLATQVPVENEATKATALFFPEQTVDSLMNAVERFQTIENQFDSSFIRAHAERFDESLFIERIQQFVEMQFQHHKEKRVYAE